MDNLDSPSGSVCWTIRPAGGPFLGIGNQSTCRNTQNGAKVYGRYEQTIERYRKEAQGRQGVRASRGDNTRLPRSRSWAVRPVEAGRRMADLPGGDAEGPSLIKRKE